jgi:hypothetical protein
MTSEPLDLEPIKARLAAATPGPWVWVDHNGAPEYAQGEITDGKGNPLEWGGRCGIESEANAPTEDDDLSDPKWSGPVDVLTVLGPVEDDEDDGVYEIPISDADAALIVNAPDDIAALVAEVERLRAQLTQLTP